MARPKEKLSKKFERKFKGFIADRTMIAYKKVIDQIEENNLVVSSESKYLQVKATLAKCKEIGLEVNYLLPKWTKRGDNVKENILDKLIPKDQLNTILEKCPKTSKGNQLKTAIKLAYHSGLRLQETLDVKPKDIKIGHNNVITVQGKGNKTRKTYYPISLIEDIEKYQQLTEIDRDYITTAIRNIKKKTGINFSFHSLRHSFASNMLESGVAIHQLSNLLGHSSIQTTLIYLHTNNKMPEAMKINGY